MKKTARPKKSQNNCARFKLDIADYASGDVSNITGDKQNALLEHLRACAGCRQTYFDYENIYAAARTIARSKEPGFQAKMDAMLEQIKKECAGKPDAKPACQPKPKPEITNGK